MINNTTNTGMIVVNQNIIPNMPNKESRNLPFDVESELGPYSKLYVQKVCNCFNIFHCCEKYNILGELPNGEIQLLFTSQHHCECGLCNCCDDCMIYCCCCTYVCCDKIIFQMDYEKNGMNFYTQGINQRKGCYFCDICCCMGCSCKSVLFLRENTNPNDPSFDVGIKKGKTLGNEQFCSMCRDRENTYVSQENIRGYKIRLPCFDACKASFMYCCCKDLEMHIEDGGGNKVGSIIIPASCNSKKFSNDCCCFQGRYYEIILPPQATSFQKFQIVAEVIHFDLENMKS